MLTHAQATRVTAGDEYIDSEHFRLGLEELGLPVEAYDLPDAVTGRSF